MQDVEEISVSFGYVLVEVLQDVESVQKVASIPCSLLFQLFQSLNDGSLLVCDDGLWLSSHDVEEIAKNNPEVQLSFGVHQANAKGNGIVVVVLAEEQS